MVNRSMRKLLGCNINNVMSIYLICQIFNTMKHYVEHIIESGVNGQFQFLLKTFLILVLLQLNTFKTRSFCFPYFFLHYLSWVCIYLYWRADDDYDPCLTNFFLTFLREFSCSLFFLQIHKYWFYSPLLIIMFGILW